MVITSKCKGTPQAFHFPQVFRNVVSPMIPLESALHSFFLKATAFVMPLGDEAVKCTVRSAPRCIP